jgi:hypothetical protein
MGNRNLAPSLVVHRGVNVLKKRSRPVNVQNLQAIADTEDRLTMRIRVMQKQFVDRVARQIGIGGLRITGSAVLFGTHIGAATREQNGVAPGGQSLEVRSCAIERNANRFSSREFDCPDVLRQGTRCVVRVAGMWDRNGNARPHPFDCTG